LSVFLFGAPALVRLSAQSPAPDLISRNTLPPDSPAAKPGTEDPAPEQREAAANRFVHEILPYWQHRLQLDDWTVYVLLARPADLRTGTLGNIHWDAEKKQATIRVMDASGYPGDLAPMLKDMEVTVVHELVHLELASMPVAEADRNNQENAIDRITAALLQSGR
jgi:hypothetical protein